MPFVESLGYDSEIPEERTCHAWATSSWTDDKHDDGDVKVYVMVWYLDSFILTCSCIGARRWFKEGLDFRECANGHGCKHMVWAGKFLAGK